MAKPRNRKSGSRSKKRRNKRRTPRDFDFVQITARPIGEAELQRFMASPPTGTWMPDPEKLALMGRIGRDLDTFELEVANLPERSGAGIMLGAAISAELWDRCGAAARWEDLDVDRTMERLGPLSPDELDFMRLMLGSLVIWLDDTHRLAHEAADEKLQALFQGEPAVVTAAHATADALFDELAFAPARSDQHLPN